MGIDNLNFSLPGATTNLLRTAKVQNNFLATDILKKSKEKRNDRTKPLKKLIKFVLKREKQKNVVLK